MKDVVQLGTLVDLPDCRRASVVVGIWLKLDRASRKRCHISFGNLRHAATKDVHVVPGKQSFTNQKSIRRVVGDL